MATAAFSTRAVLRGASKAAVPKKTSLAYQMHKQLYPHLYAQNQDAAAAPTDAIPEASRQLTESKVSSILEKERASRKAPWSKKDTPSSRFSVLPSRTKRHTSGIVLHPAKPSIHKQCPDPIATVTTSSIAQLDPTGARTRLFAKTNPEGARVGDILLVRQRTGDPFAGVCINIRRRGVDTAILLRGQLTRVGVEMWYKVYSPLVEGIEVVQRAKKRARRARLTFMRTVKHDRGSVENVTRIYLRQKAALGSADGKKKAGAVGAAKGGNRRGKKR
ncbi:hypothetical protein BU24DRAFT_457178 [Aaosphaeria arxii CBS 175.79]|uniref:Mitochondrial ribosomal protein-like protein n=1 Tax=Aaosphaeria arxii CBS 175.79 TaxID=1450172 RepID=A0A6A5Y7B4_9PLEO|nr:uncharacterized protein BU24DRAFT_457178 [Aaosphaeria arxii CBS 175.79]KAF2021176.1 hypothetical protein BU24DRAFT_457178 [Aaosphaeria arxii CBS 175.79]